MKRVFMCLEPNGLSYQLLKVLGKISAARESSVGTSEKLLAMLESNDKKANTHESLVDDIAKTTKLKDEYAAKVDSLWIMKRDTLNGSEEKA
jgi:hypothetical protein